MKYSYITPRKKSVFTQEIQLLFIFFGMSLLMLLGTYGFLAYKDYRYEAQKNEIRINILELNSSINNMEASINYIEREVIVAERVHTKNTVLKDSIANLFDLVPERITLSEAKLLKNGLILYGITPNKDVYNFMLQAPLRSIFHRTYSSFYHEKNGWLRFVSTNYMDDEQEEMNSEN